MQQAYAPSIISERTEYIRSIYKPVEVFVTEVERADSGFVRLRPHIVTVSSAEELLETKSKAQVLHHNMVKQPTAAESKHIEAVKARAALHQYHRENQPAFEKIAEFHWSRVLVAGILLFVAAMLIGPLSGPVSLALAAL